MEYEEALDHLDRLINHEVRPRAGVIEGLSLGRMQKLMAVMGDPQTTYRVVHVTGTNGKGSTAMMTARLLQAMGLTVGLYTSPHLRDVTERIQVGAKPVDVTEGEDPSEEGVGLGLEAIDPDEFGAAIGDVAQFDEFLTQTDPELGPLTWFETVTAAALRHFADVAVDVAVIEVGLLGRYDATNVVDADVAVITNVGRDHTDGQGDWRERIAGEKAGIIKPDSVVVLGEANLDVRAIFAGEPHRSFLVIGDDFALSDNQIAVGGRLVSMRTALGAYEDVFVGLHGEHQAVNALLATVAAEALVERALPDDVVAEGLGDVGLPGRFEVVASAPVVILDGAHNVDGAAALVQGVATAFGGLGQRFYVVGMQDGRDPGEVLEALDVAGAELVLCTTAPTARGIPAAVLADAAVRLGARVEIAPDPVDALDRALVLARDDDVVIVAGSFTVVGAAREAIIAQIDMGDDRV